MCVWINQNVGRVFFHVGSKLYRLNNDLLILRFQEEDENVETVVADASLRR